MAPVMPSEGVTAPPTSGTDAAVIAAVLARIGVTVSPPIGTLEAVMVVL
jgi:hypothetical protein